MSNINDYPKTEYDSETCDIKFYPSVYQQRYTKVWEILNEFSYTKKLTKVIDFGCSELGFFTLLKSLPKLELLIHIDVDEETLNDNYIKVKPLVSDYLQPKTHSFHVQVFKGSIGEQDPVIIDATAVVCIELIEHLYPDVLEEVPYNILGVSQPDLAIFTTPNVEYNILFSNYNKLRNHDHKFEWTRAQFQDWAQNLCLRFPNYSVAFTGVGPPPDGYSVVGFVTQIAIFTKSYTDNSIRNDQYESKYKLIYETKYPVCIDNRTLDEKVLEEIQYKLEMLANPNDVRYDEFINDGDRLLIPIKDIVPFVEKFGVNEDSIIKIVSGTELAIKNGKDFVVKTTAYHRKSESESDSEINSELEIKNVYCPSNTEPEELWD